ncbi:MAG TPA: nucleoside triphosphate pyrophosphohydrolase [Tissierellales bacterium]|nr:nucleoside triphosphate pyrophosphohydrolase [Tissierellales bacterium]
MKKIYVLGLGPGDVNLLTLKAVERLNSGKINFLRTEKHPTVDYLRENNIAYRSYDYIYENSKDFEQIYDSIAKDLIKQVKIYNSINYFTPGNPLVAEKSVELLIKLAEREKIDIEIVPGMSFIDPIISGIKRDPINGLKILDALVLKSNELDINVDNIITQVYNKRVASEVKLTISEVYGDEYEIIFIDSSGMKDKEKMLRIPVYKLDRLEEIGDLTSVYVPKVDKKQKKVYDINDLLNIMEKLRSAEGCPWDIRQTYTSLRENVIEEAYEVVDAVDNEDIDGLAEELGDLLLQVVFYSQMAKEDGYFNFIDITTAITDKLIFRHPHVFNVKKLEKSDEVVYNWNHAKFKSRNLESYTDRLKDIQKLPALMKSYKVQERASDIGFDWNNVAGALEKVKEEYFEVLEALELFEGGDARAIEEELGDLLFSVVNVCRFLNLNPEVVLNKTTNKFIKRFEKMEIESEKIGKKLEEMTLEEMDVLWNKSKVHKNL